VRPCGSPLAGRNGGGGQAEAQSLAVAERRRDPGDGGARRGNGLGARVTGGGSRGRVSYILPAPSPGQLGWAGRPPVGVSGPLPGRPANSVPGRAGPGTGTGHRPCQPVHEMDRAGLGLGRAKKTGFRAGHRVAGSMVTYTTGAAHPVPTHLLWAWVPRPL